MSLRGGDRRDTARPSSGPASVTMCQPMCSSRALGFAVAHSTDCAHRAPRTDVTNVRHSSALCALRVRASAQLVHVLAAACSTLDTLACAASGWPSSNGVTGRSTLPGGPTWTRDGVDEAQRAQRAARARQWWLPSRQSAVHLSTHTSQTCAVLAATACQVRSQR